ncbi:DUF6233 domain-containing protein [Streptomyces gardneri]|uniref:Uncharacterized protein n=1 Tax=Streptomyces gardneri TaxID=66892 RepID=A0A4Y3RVW6_9ACTN|nr:hypothetical protein SGA01_56850 [Streptomyces gardneri]GHH21167.1 hypothetical protein GCM10017674_75640 [Streptomyces gardneri]
MPNVQLWAGVVHRYTASGPEGKPQVNPSKRPAPEYLPARRRGKTGGGGEATVHEIPKPKKKAPAKKGVDCAEAPQGVSRLSLDQALSAAERPGVRLCSLCGCLRRTRPRPTRLHRGL